MLRRRGIIFMHMGTILIGSRILKSVFSSTASDVATLGGHLLVHEYHSDDPF